MIVAVGETVLLLSEGLEIACKVIDVKASWGKNRLLITPLAGNGERWVELTSVKLTPRHEMLAS